MKTNITFPNWACDWLITWSSILIETNFWNKVFSILNDAWAFQWEEKENDFYLKYTPDTITLTHNHLDHIWNLLYLVNLSDHNLKQIVTNRHSWNLLKIHNEDILKNILRDAFWSSNMKIPHNSSMKNLKHSIKRDKLKWDSYKDEELSDYIDNPQNIIADVKDIELPFSEDDINRVQELSSFVKWNKWKKLTEWVEMKQYASWHALGSSFVYKIWEWNKEKMICCTWDLWPEKTIIEWDKQTEIPKEELDVLVIEWLYWDRNRESLDSSIEELVNQINFTIKKWWNVFLPTFAFDKLPKLIELLERLKLEWKIPKNSKVFYDTSLWDKLMWQYRGTSWVYKNIHKAIKLEQKTREKALSEKWNIFLITWWMDIEKWSWRNYFWELEKNDNLFLWTNYIEPTTSLYSILEKQISNIELWESIYNIKTRVSRIAWFSWHKDQADLINYFKQIKFKPWAKVIINHGSINAMKTLQTKFKEIRPNIDISLASSNDEIII